MRAAMQGSSLPSAVAAAQPTPRCARLHARALAMPLPAARRALLLGLLVILSSSSTRAVIRSAGGGTGGARTGGTGAGTTASSTTYNGRSIGVQNRYRIASAVILTYVLFNGYSYPSMRFYYDGYYDDCALRNLTSSQLSGNDSAIDIDAVNSLPTLLPDAASSSDIFAFNQSLYNATNGLVIDSTYCNYTQPGAAGAVRWSLMVSLAMAIVAAFGLGGFGRKWR